MKKHPFDPVSFLFGMFFVAIAASVTLADEAIFTVEGRWFWPVAVIVAGVVMTLSSLRDRS